jgi:kynurenine formamidase
MIEWSKRGGIVGRGILIDWASWAEEKGIEYRADSKHCISEKELDEIAREKGIEFRAGDILLVRTGWIKWYNTSSQKVRVDGTKVRHEYIGIDSSRASIEWLWNHHFSAVAADTMAFEAWPATDPAIRE